MSTPIKTILSTVMFTASLAMITLPALAHNEHGHGAGFAVGHAGFTHMQSHTVSHVTHSSSHHADDAGFHGHHATHVGNAAGHYSHGYAPWELRQPWRENNYASQHWPYYWQGGFWRGVYWPRVYASVTLPLFIVSLPANSVTYWYDDVPYYYANHVYYLRDVEQNGYVVATPPLTTVSHPDAATVTQRLFVYPRNGQSNEQQASDEQACRQWAGDQLQAQAAMEPTADAVSDYDSSDYQRAMIACLDGRGYTAK